jgi:hypothetical protein
MASTRQIGKHRAVLIAGVVVSPLIAAAKVEAWLAKGESCFSTCGAWLSLIPGKVGNYLRLGFYYQTIEECSPEVCFSFGSMVTRRAARVGRRVTIGAYRSVGTATIGDHVQIASRVSILSGGRQHDLSDPAGEIADHEPVFERVHIGANAWIGEGAIVLADAGYEVREVSYGSLVGEKTDLFDWPAKFRDEMGKILACDRQDSFFTDARRQDIVVFKPWFPNNFFVGKGQSPGNPQGPDRTVENAKAAYRALLPESEKVPQTLFVAVTAPPLALSTEPLYKAIAKRLLGRPSLAKSGPLAREFNNWLKDAKGNWPASCFDCVHCGHVVTTASDNSNVNIDPEGVFRRIRRSLARFPGFLGESAS